MTLNPHSHRITDLMYLFKYMMDRMRPVFHPDLYKMKGISFWISLPVRYTQPTKELTDIHAQ